MIGVSERIVCPRCGEATGATWQPLPQEPGYRPVYALRHRRRGGGRCMAVRGESLNVAGSVTITIDSRSEHAESAPTAR